MDRLDDLDLYDDVSELGDEDLGELDESVVVVCGPSSTDDRPSRSQLRSYYRYCLLASVISYCI